MKSIDFFKSKAKFLKKDFDNQNFEAILRYESVFLNKEKPTLMNFQHVIAKEAAFNNWNELQQSNEIKLSVATVLYENHTLNGSGYRFNWQELKRKSISEQKKYKQECRRELLDDSDFIFELSLLLKKHIQPTETIRKNLSSYKIKHVMERSLIFLGGQRSYISNGQLITAGILAGFKFVPCTQEHTGLSVYFNMQQKSLMKLPGYRG